MADRICAVREGGRRVSRAVRPLIHEGNIMNKDQVKGAGKDAAGKVQDSAGQATGSGRQQAKGVAKQVEGKAQKAMGNAKEALKGSNRK
jgi:uncharacterized protein YjbJ (UPF0337 family)